MFLMFTLHRPDVLPTGDQGIKNAVKRAYGLDAVPTPDALTEIAEPWRPHRTRACLYLWRSLGQRAYLSRASSRSRSRSISRWTSWLTLPSLRRPSTAARSALIRSRRTSP